MAGGNAGRNYWKLLPRIACLFPTWLLGWRSKYLATSTARAPTNRRRGSQQKTKQLVKSGKLYRCPSWVSVPLVSWTGNPPSSFNAQLQEPYLPQLIKCLIFFLLLKNTFYFYMCTSFKADGFSVAFLFLFLRALLDLLRSRKTIPCN